MSEIVAAGKYTRVQTSGLSHVVRASARPESANLTDRLKPAQPAERGPTIFVPKRDPSSAKAFQEWFWRELKEGGRLHRYLAREKATSDRRLRAVARRMHGVKRNLRADTEIKAVVPAREFFRWKATDPDFWADDKNLKSYRRDNPDAVVFV